jgi:NhaA family Na+:H+ antiporter
MANIERFPVPKQSHGVTSGALRPPSGRVPSTAIAEAPARLFGAVVRPVQAFVRLEAASGILLLVSAVAALAWANLAGASYQATFGYRLAVGAGDALAHFTIAEFINDGWMTIFFLVVGMEIKRELAVGELNTVRKAVLPAIAALGGMVVPAGVFLAATWGSEARIGWGIPMATDIAFCVGILTLVGKRVPHALVVFVTALAIFDDIGGILVIALFYGHGLHLAWLLGAVGCTLILWGMNRSYVINGLAYAIAGSALWFALHRSGIHATIAGVILGLMIPARPERPCRQVISELADHVKAMDNRAPDEELEGAEILMIEEKLEDLEAPLNRFVHLWHPFVAFLIMPAFALANAGVAFGGAGAGAFATPVALGTALGLFFGKQIGIFGSTMLAVRLGVSPMPGRATKGKLYGVSVLAGIGFTVALFIATLAYDGARAYLDEAKMGILLGSALAGIVGFMLLRFSSERSEAT